MRTRSRETDLPDGVYSMVSMSGGIVGAYRDRQRRKTRFWGRAQHRLDGRPLPRPRIVTTPELVERRALMEAARAGDPVARATLWERFHVRYLAASGEAR